MNKDEIDLKHGLNKIRENLLLLQDHFISYPCPKCIKKHLALVTAYAEESLPMASDEKIRNFLIKLRDFTLDMRRKLGDIL
jgi:hypothetical protein